MTGVVHQALLLSVSERLAKTPSVTDYLMLTKWRVLSLCQYLLGEPSVELEAACVAALQAFAAHGAGAASDKALDAAAAIVKKLEGAQSVLPSISSAKRLAVARHLDSLAADGTAAVQRARSAIATVRTRINESLEGMSLPGIRHRFELVVRILEDAGRPEHERARAAAAVLYVEEISDVISDRLGIIGMLDDDYALRVVIDELGAAQDGAPVHWSERISSLWDDLPFLQGVNLHRDDVPMSVTWLDRVNSYVSYSHVLGVEKTPLVLLQPSIACSPVHAIVSLIGLLVLDAITAAESKAHALRVGQVYEIDGFFARFEGAMTGPPTPGWLKLRWSDSIQYQPPALADRMIPVETKRLSPARKFAARPRAATADPMQRFFDWETTIGPASISSRLVLVASRQRALDLLEGVQSNGVRLLDHGLVRFVGANADDVETHGTLLLVVPSLSTARHILDRGVRVQAILVDGYERLHRGRHELPFLLNRRDAPSIVNWSATGYYPAEPPVWLPPHKRLEVSSADLAGILELDDSTADLSSSTLWEAATGATIRARLTQIPVDESAVVEAIDAYARALRTSEHLPEYWKYHLAALVRTLRLLVTSTPAEWDEVRRVAHEWSSSIDEKWTSLRSSAATALAGLRNAEKQVLTLLDHIREPVNSRAVGLAAFIAEGKQDERWCLVCDRPEQVKVAGSFLRSRGVRNVVPALLHDVAVCTNCVVAGWVSSTFARRLWAHTPRAVVALVDASERQKWNRAADAQRQPAGQSMLGAIGAASTENTGVLSLAGVHVEMDGDDFDATAINAEKKPCVFVWLVGYAEAKVLARDSRVVVEEGELIRERSPAQLRPDDRVILGVGTSRWSPADEFTGAVVEAVEAAQPNLVARAREWRRALRRLQGQHRLSAEQISTRLAAVGVKRERQTIDGWLDVEHASPISPRGMRTELTRLWSVIADVATCSLDEVADACERLRSLRNASGRALVQLWKGNHVDLGIDATAVSDLVERLRQEVQVYEVEAVTLGEVPEAMFGWWVPASVATHFEADSLASPSPSLEDGDGDGDDAGTT